jgi:hypothetical protein
MATFDEGVGAFMRIALNAQLDTNGVSTLPSFIEPKAGIDFSNVPANIVPKTRGAINHETAAFELFVWATAVRGLHEKCHAFVHMSRLRNQFVAATRLAAVNCANVGLPGCTRTSSRVGTRQSHWIYGNGPGAARNLHCAAPQLRMLNHDH